MHLFPLFADLTGRRVLIVGGGGVAERKTALLLAAGAQIEIVARELTPAFVEWVGSGRLRHRTESFSERQVDNAWLVIAATDDSDLNAAVAAAAGARRIFVNVVDDAVLSTFHVPAIVDRSPLIIAISSGGAAPMLARLARERIETLFDRSWGALAALLARARDRIRARYARVESRRRFYERVLRGKVAQLVQQQRLIEAQSAFDAILEQGTPFLEARFSDLQTSQPAVPGAFSDRYPCLTLSQLPLTSTSALSPPIGTVVLVGAGPGDPGLLTLNALRALNEADVILYDRLVGAEVLDLARRDAMRVDVGKQVGCHRGQQARIHALMLEHARAGRCVVRLKGGDPFIFGRGGEEIEFLRAHGIDYRIVPGITAALACAAYAGIPLTHRDHAQSVRLQTAHRRDAPANAAPAGETRALYMGVGEFAALRERLLAEGLSPNTPIAMIENGTRPQQRVVLGDLAGLVERARLHDVKSPALLIVGAVAALAAQQHWFGAAPLLSDPAVQPQSSPPLREAA